METTRVFALLLAVAALPGCAILQSATCLTHCGDERTASTSVVSYLYSDRRPPETVRAMPHLSLPLRIGLASLPSRYGDGIGPAGKLAVLERTRARFEREDFIAEIVVIPEHYLQSGGGFARLEQLQRLYGVDVIALLSYDQIINNDENELALGYLTVVGTLFLAGSEHEVSTLVDLAVVDVPTRSLILRAGGTSERSGTTTAARKNRSVRRDQTAGFDIASDQMIDQLAIELEGFRTRVRDGTAPVTVTNTGGGGTAGWPALGGLVLVVLFRYGRRVRES